jgi:hypothetical protein
MLLGGLGTVTFFVIFAIVLAVLAVPARRAGSETDIILKMG